jgi:hypothetical protein
MATMSNDASPAISQILREFGLSFSLVEGITGNGTSLLEISLSFPGRSLI